MKTRDKILIICSSLVVVTAAIIILLIQPIATGLAEIKRNIEENSVALEINKRQAENLTVIKKDFESLKQKNSLLDNMIISQENQLALFKDIENLALDYNLEQTFNLETPNTQTSPQEVIINLQLTGNFTNILKFLSGLEQLSYYVKVNTLKFNASLDPEETVVILEAKTYWK